MPRRPKLPTDAGHFRARCLVSDLCADHATQWGVWFGIELIEKNLTQPQAEQIAIDLNGVIQLHRLTRV